MQTTPCRCIFRLIFGWFNRLSGLNRCTCKKSPSCLHNRLRKISL
ncbi:hypothetical protein NEIPOLOT_01791 [Neisseria polysaccharea ATCC 43768]|nr:hypothetical protein NEIPOLOT_01791 [Neisseria polysaccharea ATCC 43768]